MHLSPFSGSDTLCVGCLPSWKPYLLHLGSDTACQVTSLCECLPHSAQFWLCMLQCGTLLTSLRLGHSMPGNLSPLAFISFCLASDTLSSVHPLFKGLWFPTPGSPLHSMWLLFSLSLDSKSLCQATSSGEVLILPWLWLPMLDCPLVWTLS